MNRRRLLSIIGGGVSFGSLIGYNVINKSAIAADLTIENARIPENKSSSQFQFQFSNFKLTTENINSDNKIKIEIMVENTETNETIGNKEWYITVDSRTNERKDISDELSPILLDNIENLNEKDDSVEIKFTISISHSDINTITQSEKSIIKIIESEIPDAAFSWYDATKLSLNDGESISEWNDEISSNTLYAGIDGTYIQDGINGLPAIKFNSNEYLRWSNDIDFLGREFFITFVMTEPSLGSNNHILSFREDGTNNGVVFRFRDDQNDVWLSSSGPNWDPPTSPSVNGINMKNEDTQSYDIRYNENSNTGSWDNNFPKTQLGLTADGDSTLTTSAKIGEIVIGDAGLSDDAYNNEINRLANKWNIPI